MVWPIGPVDVQFLYQSSAMKKTFSLTLLCHFVWSDLVGLLRVVKVVGMKEVVRAQKL
jgi:hypothetical protein